MGEVADEIRIVRGAPTDEELAAIVCVLLAARSTARAGEPATRASSLWARSARAGRRQRDADPSTPAASAWRASGQPG